MNSKLLYLTSYPLYLTAHPLYLCHHTQIIDHITPIVCMMSQTQYVWHHMNSIWHHIHSLWYHTILWHHIHCIPLVCLMVEKGMANHFGILDFRTPWAVWKAKRYDTEGWIPKVSRCSVCYWRNNSRKNEEMAPMQKQHKVLDMTGDGSKVWCDKEQYCIGTWNVRSMNQGKLKVVKQVMTRVTLTF